MREEAALGWGGAAGVGVGPTPAMRGVVGATSTVGGAFRDMAGAQAVTVWVRGHSRALPGFGGHCLVGGAVSGSEGCSWALLRVGGITQLEGHCLDRGAHSWIVQELGGRIVRFGEHCLGGGGWSFLDTA